MRHVREDTKPPALEASETYPPDKSIERNRRRTADIALGLASIIIVLMIVLLALVEAIS
jgi:hypothetical protein